MAALEITCNSVTFALASGDVWSIQIGKKKKTQAEGYRGSSK